MVVIIFSINDEIKIISDDEYNNCYGIITHIENGYYFILTIKNPAEKYMVRIEEAENKLTKCDSAKESEMDWHLNVIDSTRR